MDKPNPNSDLFKDLAKVLAEGAQARAVRQPKGAALPSLDSPAAALASVAACIRAYPEAFAASRAKKEYEYDARRRAAQAYRDTMPLLFGRASIRDFVACVAHAMLIEAIDAPSGARLLYAAQVASTVNKRSHHASPKAPPNTANKPVTPPVTEAEPAT